MILRTRQRKIDFFDFFLILHSPYLPFHVFYTSLYSTTCPIKSTVVFSLSSLFYKTTTFCVSHRYVPRETKYIKSTVTIFKSNARETWHAILVSFADIYLTESLCILHFVPVGTKPLSTGQCVPSRSVYLSRRLNSH